MIKVADVGRMWANNFWSSSPESATKHSLRAGYNCRVVVMTCISSAFSLKNSRVYENHWA